MASKLFLEAEQTLNNYLSQGNKYITTLTDKQIDIAYQQMAYAQHQPNLLKQDVVGLMAVLKVTKQIRRERNEQDKKQSLYAKLLAQQEKKVPQILLPLVRFYLYFRNKSFQSQSSTPTIPQSETMISGSSSQHFSYQEPNSHAAHNQQNYQFNNKSKLN